MWCLADAAKLAIRSGSCKAHAPPRGLCGAGAHQCLLPQTVPDAAVAARVMEFVDRGFLGLGNVRLFVLDEADGLLDTGNRVRQDGALSTIPVNHSSQCST